MIAKGSPERFDPCGQEMTILLAYHNRCWPFSSEIGCCEQDIHPFTLAINKLSGIQSALE
jgi:hypothetical protein